MTGGPHPCISASTAAEPRRRWRSSIRDGEIRATHLAPGCLLISIGLDALGTLLADAVSNVLAKAALRAADLDFAFFGLPAYGEDSALVGALSRLPEQMPAGRPVMCAATT